jgi:hypothetical protein
MRTVQNQVIGVIVVVGVIMACGGLAAGATELPPLDDDTLYRLALKPDTELQWQQIATGKPYSPTLQRPAYYNLDKVYMANAARERWLFAFTFAAPYHFDNTSLLVYLDTDNDPTTGRPGMGCEVTFGHREGHGSTGLYVDDTEAYRYVGPRWALVDGVLFLCVDMPLNQQGDQTQFRLQILSEQVAPHEGRDAIGMHEVTGPANSDRERLITLVEREGTEGFQVTQDMAYLWAMQADRRNVILNSYRLGQYKGFEYNHTEYRWPSLRRNDAEGTVTVKITRPGRYYPGVVVYDGPGRENYALYVGDEKIGHFSATEDNRRQRLFFATQSREFRRGDTLTLRAASANGACIVEDFVLLAEQPVVHTPPRAIENLQVGWDWEAACLRVTWTTTWPTVCTLTYPGGQIAEETPLQNHRLYLSDLPLNQSGTLRLEAQSPEGRAAVRFTAAPPALPKGMVARAQLPLQVLFNTTSPPPAGYPLTTGIPFGAGELGSAEELRLLSEAGHELPLQTRVLSRWPDHSVKVVLLDTPMPADMSADGSSSLVLEYGHEVQRQAVNGGLRVTEEGQLITVTTPTLQAQFDRTASGLFTSLWRDPAGQFGPETLLTQPDRPVRVVLTDEQGQVFDTLGPPEEVTIEEAGPLRTVIRLVGHHQGEAGQLFTYQVRLTFVAHHPGILLSYRFGNDSSRDEFTSIKGIRLELPLALAADTPLSLGGEEQPVTGQLAAGARLQQLVDDQYTAGSHRGKRAPGWLLLGAGERQVGVVPRHFWQLYPKAIGVEQGVPCYDIAPLLATDQYAEASDLDLIKLYYYLQDGLYKFRQGMTMTHDSWLVFPASGEQMPELAELTNQPPMLAASPDHYAATVAFGRFITRTSGRTPRYDEITDRVRTGYLAHRESNRTYGMLNFGDMFGERGLNWFNGEYDHHFGAAQMFVRSGELSWFHLMQEMARHDIDVDHCHYHTNPRWVGGKWIHAMGHTGRYFRYQYDLSRGVENSG